MIFKVIAVQPAGLVTVLPLLKACTPKRKKKTFIIKENLQRNYGQKMLKMVTCQMPCNSSHKKQHTTRSISVSSFFVYKQMF